MRAVALAVGEIFEKCWHGILLGVFRKPHARREPGAVGERNPQVLDLPHLVRKIADRRDAHEAPLRKSALLLPAELQGWTSKANMNAS
jgi:hypothetical protein